jgi:biopolymer transport protein TolR
LTLAEFRVVVKQLAMNRSRNGVYLRADQNVNYGMIAQLLGIMNGAGISNVGLVTEPEEIR